MKVDLARHRVVARTPVGAGPIQAYVSPDGELLLVANQGTEDDPGTTVSVVDTDSFEVVRTIETGAGAHGVVIDPTGRRAYVTDIYANDVAVVDLQQLSVVARIPVGEAPNGISFSPVVVDKQPTVELPMPDTGMDSHGGDEGGDGGHGDGH